ncbi:MAG TPA: YafY family protein [Caulobacteraceae bacterium]|nr:YafY family protein [Caulobacteraceae bacterium]
MRHDKAARLLTLARMLAGSAEGLTLDEMAAELGVGRRTAERLRDAVREVFPQLEEIDDPPTRRWRIGGGLDGLFQAPDADELAALRGAAETLAAQGAGVRARALRELERKILASMRAPARRRLAPDMEALVQAETIAVHAGPRPFEDAGVLAAVRTAIKGLGTVGFTYHGGSAPGRRREVTPLGILFGRSNYLVASENGGAPRSWRFDRIRDLELLDRPGAAPADFSLQAFADESFGIYHGAMEDVVLIVDADRAADALAWRFHANQTVESLPDGRVRVTFRAGGMLELAWHLFTWSDAIEVVSPPALKAVLVEELTKALKRHGG